MHFTTSFVLAFIAATSAPSLAAPIPSHESDVEHAHGYSGHSHLHVARSPLLATLVKAQNQAPKPTAPKPKPKGKHRRSFDVDDFQELEARSPISPGSNTPSTPKPSPGKPIPGKPTSPSTPQPKKKQRRDLTLDLEARDVKHRRSFDFDDFQELEARSPVSPGPNTPSTPKPGPGKPIPGKPTSQNPAQPKKKQRRDLTLELEARALLSAAVKGLGQIKTNTPNGSHHHRRFFEFDDFQELEARSPTPASKNPSPPRPSAIPPPRSSVAPSKGKPQRQRRDLTLDLEARGLLAAAMKAQNQALKGPTPQAKNAPAKKGHRRRSFELEIDELD